MATLYIHDGVCMQDGIATIQTLGWGQQGGDSTRPVELATFQLKVWFECY